MRLHIEHATIFTYAQPVREAIGEGRLRPRDDAGQPLISFQLALDPPAPLDIVANRFGNTIHCYSVLPPHQRMVVTATSVVETSAAPLIAAPPLMSMQRHDFNAALLAFARDHAPANIGATGTAQALLEAIYTSCAYELGSTDTSTTAAVVLAERRGVCQDFAHLLIGLCRSLGLLARYVSGYLYDPDQPSEAILASHAWAEVFLDGRGWLGLDPTHNRTTGPRYTCVAVGRDYADAAPVRGVGVVAHRRRRKCGCAKKAPIMVAQKISPLYQPGDRAPIDNDVTTIPALPGMLECEGGGKVRWQLKELAEECGFNPHSLALEAKLSYNTMRPIWLNQSKRADLDTIGALARVLKVAPGALLVEETEAQP